MAIERASSGRASTVVKEVAVAIKGNEGCAVCAGLVFCGWARDAPTRSGSLGVGERCEFLHSGFGRGAVPKHERAAPNLDPLLVVDSNRPVRVTCDHAHGPKDVAVGKVHAQFRNVAGYGN